MENLIGIGALILLLIYFFKKAKNNNDINYKDDNGDNVLKLSFYNFPYNRKEYQILFDRLEIAGINYRFNNAKKIFTNEDVYIVFEKEPNNKYDKNAIAIYGVNENKKEHIGYVDKETARFIAENNLYDFVAPNLKFIMIGYKKVLISDYQILIKKEKMKELRNNKDKIKFTSFKGVCKI
jgi:hypothetical protein